MKNLLISATLLIATASSASAVTSYVLPADFSPENNAVTLEASYATNFFDPQIAVSPDAFRVIAPDGSEGVFSRVEIAGEATSVATPLPDFGTYRISTGEIASGVTTLVGVDGGWRPLAQGEAPPEGAQTTTLQTITVAEAYVTRGGPTRDAVDADSGRLAIRPVTHPNQILVAQGFQVQLTFDGAPFANMPLVLYSNGEPDTDVDRYVVTDANGNATLTFDQAGRYVVAVRHRANAAPGAAAAVQSYTTSLTFEALTTLPPVVEQRTQAEEAREAAERRARRDRRREGSRVGGIRN